jgi:WXG100 family type VII secretion target
MGVVMALIRVNYEMMKKFQNSFRGQETAVQQTTGKLTKVIDQLRGGDWIGEGATAFFNEMDSEVIPAMKRLQNVMAEGDRVSKEIEKIQHETESSIESIFTDILNKFGNM